ncbi:hypothetical protein CEXT_75601 [Caerostris extrusa]|uniref:Uncharacterized protein n=1 Tax=Caerostris extrusa TaxID=172846 RepID=A0AAV4XS77_CAEEX|nr:hypothetical protein CEXT_75601 [Caerostris extrusa]
MIMPTTSSASCMQKEWILPRPTNSTVQLTTLMAMLKILHTRARTITTIIRRYRIPYQLHPHDNCSSPNSIAPDSTNSQSLGTPTNFGNYTTLPRSDYSDHPDSKNMRFQESLEDKI